MKYFLLVALVSSSIVVPNPSPHTKDQSSSLPGIQSRAIHPVEIAMGRKRRAERRKDRRERRNFREMDSAETV